MEILILYLSIPQISLFGQELNVRFMKFQKGKCTVGIVLSSRISIVESKTISFILPLYQSRKQKNRPPLRRSMVVPRTGSPPLRRASVNSICYFLRNVNSFTPSGREFFMVVNYTIKCNRSGRKSRRSVTERRPILVLILQPFAFIAICSIKQCKNLFHRKAPLPVLFGGVARLAAPLLHHAYPGRLFQAGIICHRCIIQPEYANMPVPSAVIEIISDKKDRRYSDQDSSHRSMERINGYCAMISPSLCEEYS